ncbi:MAG: undecaprenyl/decaprenyl-phosphate alpha-N-acetylglucosaminyl 1-phosphate transferase, partial [Streptococcaceae bacterium]|nr:undecaprenyl/decaprenyl-phosphate alpha-N-acetylglucosaminyl 1-phosphate transferase [Streptococcaceae bacterium]
MSFILSFIITWFITFFIGLILTPILKKLSFKIGAVDKPNARRINKVIMPTAGGLPIFLAFSISTLFILPHQIQIPNYLDYVLPIVAGAFIIVVTGLIDDIKELSPKKKSIGILIAAFVIYLFSDIHFDTFSIPFLLRTVHLNWWLSLPLTIIWIFSLTNAVNLIDGLDGLASGVSIISLATIGIVG